MVIRRLELCTGLSLQLLAYYPEINIRSKKKGLSMIIRTGSGTIFITIVFLLVILLLSTSTTVLAENPAVKGDTVSVYYNLSFPGGPIFETNFYETPFTFVLGSGKVISGFDKAITGMIPGESKTVILPPEEAYGERNESLVYEMPFLDASDMLSNFNKSNVTVSLIPGYPGPLIEYIQANGTKERYVFTNITNETVIVDNNKPLAGSSLKFDITLINIT